MARQKIIRTLRCRNQNKIGVLSKLINTISSHGGDIGNVSTVSLGDFVNIRDISVLCNDESHLEEIVAAISDLEEVELDSVIDEVLELHRGGKIIMRPAHPVETIDDLRKVYTPGVASVCRLIKDDPSKADLYTTIPKTVGLITNGSRVLGLGNLGPVASMPVMEGKAALFNQFSGMHMIPVLMDTLDPVRFVDAVETISKTFSAIQLEDIRAPECFLIEDELTRRLNIPVMHDDQHGTATVALAAMINACALAKIDLKKVKVGQIGLGAAGSAVARLLMAYTGKAVMGTDLNDDCRERWKSFGGLLGSIDEIMSTCEVIAATTGVPGLIKPSQVRKGQVILALSNPYPEISIPDALAAGAAFASDGSRVNNLLGYPGILKGAVESRAKRMIPEMYIAAAEAIVAQTPQGEIVPDPLDPTVHAAVAKAVMKAVKAQSNVTD